MSFGGSPADIIIVATFCKDLYRRCRDAGSEYDEISREVRALHTVLKHLKYEVEAPESPLNRDRALWPRQLSPIVGDCNHTLRQLDSLIAKCGRLHSLSANSSPTSSRAMWDKVRLGSTELDQLGSTRVKLISHKSELTRFLDKIQLHQNGNIQATLDNHGGQLDLILDKVDAIAARMGQHNGSILTSYDDDEKEVWKQFRRELVAEGFSSDVLQQHKDVLRAYIREIDQKGLLEEVAIDPTKPPTKVGGVNPERWLESVQSDAGNNIAQPLENLRMGPDASGSKELPPNTSGRLLSPIEEQPRRNSEGDKQRVVPRSMPSRGRDMPSFHSDSSSDEDAQRSLVRSKPTSNSLIIRTSDLVSTVPSSREGEKHRDDLLTPRSNDLEVEYGTSPNWRDAIKSPETSSRRTAEESRTASRLAPDEYGNEIPPDAKWTKVNRRLISPEILDQDRRRYEARPEFVAILGVLTRAEIEDLAARTAAHRHARHIRHHPPPTLTPQSSDVPPQQPPRPGTNLKPIPIPIPVPIPFSNSRRTREDTPSSTDYTNSSSSETESSRSKPHSHYHSRMRQKKPAYAGSDAGSVHGYPNPYGQPVPPPSPILSRDGDRHDERDRSYKDVNGSTQVFNGMPRSAPEGERGKGVRFGGPQYYTHEPQLPQRHSAERDRDRERERERDRDRERERDDIREERRRDRHYHDSHRMRDHERPRERDDRRRRDRDEGRRSASDKAVLKEVEQLKKRRWKDNLTAAGIGGAAASLLNVLTEAAEGI